MGHICYLKSWPVRIFKDFSFSLYIVAASESDEGLVLNVTINQMFKEYLLKAFGDLSLNICKISLKITDWWVMFYLNSFCE